MSGSLGNKQIMANNIRRFMDDHGISRRDLCQILGFKYSTVTDWLNAEKYPRIDKIEAMANYFGVTKADLVEPPAEPEKPHKKGVKIPVLGRVAAGVPIYAEENIIDWEEISEEQARSGEYFALRVAGQSMEPTIRDGDTLIIRKQEQVENGDIAVVLVNGDEATVKEIHEDAAGLTLVGHNVAVYKPTLYTPKQVEDLPVRIIGRVVQSRHNF